MAYGSCFGNDIAWSQASAVLGTWYPITDTGIDDGVESSVTNADGVLTIGTAGVYQIVYSVGITSNMVRRIETGILVNSTVNDSGRCYAVQPLGAAYTMAGTAAITLAENDTVTIVVRTTDGGLPTLNCEFFNVSAASVA